MVLTTMRNIEVTHQKMPVVRLSPYFHFGHISTHEVFEVV